MCQLQVQEYPKISVFLSIIPFSLPSQRKAMREEGQVLHTSNSISLAGKYSRKGSQFHHLEPYKPWQELSQENMFLPLRRHNTEWIRMILWDLTAKHGFIFHYFLSITLSPPFVGAQQAFQYGNTLEAVLRRWDWWQKIKESPLHGQHYSQSTYKTKNVQEVNWRDWIPARRSSLPTCFTPQLLS